MSDQEDLDNAVEVLRSRDMANAFRTQRQYRRFRDALIVVVNALPVTWVEIDLSKAVEHDHPDLKTDGTRYRVQYGGKLYTGTFTREWYGLNFSGVYPAGVQFDAPGWNSSEWERVWVLP